MPRQTPVINLETASITWMRFLKFTLSENWRKNS